MSPIWIRSYNRLYISDLNMTFRAYKCSLAIYRLWITIHIGIACSRDEGTRPKHSRTVIKDFRLWKSSPSLSLKDWSGCTERAGVWTTCLIWRIWRLRFARIETDWSRIVGRHTWHCSIQTGSLAGWIGLEKFIFFQGVRKWWLTISGEATSSRDDTTWSVSRGLAETQK
jgi:hypothetical protein